VVKAVDRLEASGVLREMRWATRKARGAAGSGPNVPQSLETCQQIKRHVLQQLDELLQYENSLSDPEDRGHHHAMRIAAKRLRYTLEITRSICPGRLEEGVETIKRLQTLLGEIHDCDVWLDHLDAFASSQRDRIIAMFGHAGRFLHLQPGIAYLRKDRQEHRQTTFEELGRYWGELKERRFADELAGAVESGEGNAEAEKPPAEGGLGNAPGMNTESHG
jgi:hypothetical protein